MVSSQKNSTHDLTHNTEIPIATDVSNESKNDSKASNELQITSKRKYRKKESIPRELLGLCIDMDWCKDRKNSSEKSNISALNTKKGSDYYRRSDKHKSASKSHESKKSKSSDMDSSSTNSTDTSSHKSHKIKKEAKSASLLKKKNKLKKDAISKDNSKLKKVKKDKFKSGMMKSGKSKLLVLKKKDKYKVKDKHNIKMKFKSLTKLKVKKAEKTKLVSKDKLKLVKKTKKKRGRPRKIFEKNDKGRELRTHSDSSGIKRSKLSKSTNNDANVPKKSRKQIIKSLKDYPFDPEGTLKPRSTISFYKIDPECSTSLTEFVHNRKRVDNYPIQLYKGIYLVNSVTDYGSVSLVPVNEATNFSVSKYIVTDRTQPPKSDNKENKDLKFMCDTDDLKNASCFMYEGMGLYVVENDVHLCLVIKNLADNTYLFDNKRNRNQQIQPTDYKMVNRPSCNLYALAPRIGDDSPTNITMLPKKHLKNYFCIIFYVHGGVVMPILRTIPDSSYVKKIDEAAVNRYRHLQRALRQIVSSILNIYAPKETQKDRDSIKELLYQFCHSSNDAMLEFEDCECLACQLSIQFLTANSQFCLSHPVASPHCRQNSKYSTYRVANIFVQSVPTRSKPKIKNDHKLTPTSPLPTIIMDTDLTNQQEMSEKSFIEQLTLDSVHRITRRMNKELHSHEASPQSRGRKRRIKMKREMLRRDSTTSSTAFYSIHSTKTPDRHTQEFEVKRRRLSTARSLSPQQSPKYTHRYNYRHSRPKQTQSHQRAYTQSKQSQFQTKHQSPTRLRQAPSSQKNLSYTRHHPHTKSKFALNQPSANLEDSQPDQHQEEESPQPNDSPETPVVNPDESPVPNQEPLLPLPKLIHLIDTNHGFIYVGFFVKYSLIDRDSLTKKGRGWNYGVIKYWDPKYKTFFVHILKDEFVLSSTEYQIYHSLKSDPASHFSSSVQWISTQAFYIFPLGPGPVFDRLNFMQNLSPTRDSPNRDITSHPYCRICKKRILFIRTDFTKLPRNCDSTDFDEELTLAEFINEIMSSYDYPNYLFRNPVHSTVLSMRELEQVGSSRIASLLEKNLDITRLFFEDYDRASLSLYSRRTLYFCVKFIYWIRYHCGVRQKVTPETKVNLVYWGFKCSRCNDHYHAKCLQYQHLRKPAPIMDKHRINTRLSAHKTICKNFRIVTNMRLSHYSNENLYAPVDYKLDFQAEKYYHSNKSYLSNRNLNYKRFKSSKLRIGRRRLTKKKVNYLSMATGDDSKSANDEKSSQESNDENSVDKDEDLTDDDNFTFESDPQDNDEYSIYYERSDSSYHVENASDIQDSRYDSYENLELNDISVKESSIEDSNDEKDRTPNDISTRDSPNNAEPTETSDNIENETDNQAFEEDDENDFTHPNSVYYPMLDFSTESNEWHCPDCRLCVYCCLPITERAYISRFNYAYGHGDTSMKSYKQFPPCFEEKVDHLQRNCLQTERVKDVVCVSCNISAHRACCNPVVPNLLFIESWKCDSCTQCISCGYRDTTCIEYLNWGLFFFFCLKCWELLERSNYCGVCYKVWTNFDSATQKWVQCEGCKLWIHVECDELARIITECPSSRNQNYRCSICRSSNKMLRCTKILEQIFIVDKLNQFRYPVSPTFVTYWRLVTKPMNLVTLFSKLEGCKYSNMTEFIFDIFLIPHNAKMVNMPNTKIYKFALVFEKKCKQIVSTIMQITSSEIDSIMDSGLNGGDVLGDNKLLSNVDDEDVENVIEGAVTKGVKNKSMYRSDPTRDKSGLLEPLKPSTQLANIKNQLVSFNLTLEFMLAKMFNFNDKFCKNLVASCFDELYSDSSDNKVSYNETSNESMLENFKNICSFYKSFVPCGLDYPVVSVVSVVAPKFMFPPTFNKNENFRSLVRSKNLILLNKNRLKNVYLDHKSNPEDYGYKFDTYEFYIDDMNQLNNMSKMLFSRGFIQFRDFCVSCGSSAFQSYMIHCEECAEPMHYYCAGFVLPPGLINYKSFRCSSCAHCERCSGSVLSNHPYDLSNINNFHFGDALGFIPTLITNVVLFSSQKIIDTVQNQGKDKTETNQQETDNDLKKLEQKKVKFATFLDGRFKVDQNGIISNMFNSNDPEYFSKIPINSVKCVTCGNSAHLSCVKLLKPSTNRFGLYSKYSNMSRVECNHYLDMMNEYAPTESSTQSSSTSGAFDNSFIRFSGDVGTIKENPQLFLNGSLTDKDNVCSKMDWVSLLGDQNSLDKPFVYDGLLEPADQLIVKTNHTNNLTMPKQIPDSDNNTENEFKHVLSMSKKLSLCDDLISIIQTHINSGVINKTNVYDYPTTTYKLLFKGHTYKQDETDHIPIEHNTNSYSNGDLFASKSHLGFNSEFYVEKYKKYNPYNNIEQENDHNEVQNPNFNESYEIEDYETDKQMDIDEDCAYYKRRIMETLSSSSEKTQDFHDYQADLIMDYDRKDKHTTFFDLNSIFESINLLNDDDPEQQANMFMSEPSYEVKTFLNWDFDGSGLFTCSDKCQYKFDSAKDMTFPHDHLYSSALMKQFAVLQESYNMPPIENYKLATLYITHNSDDSIKLVQQNEQNYKDDNEFIDKFNYIATHHVVSEKDTGLVSNVSIYHHCLMCGKRMKVPVDVSSYNNQFNFKHGDTISLPASSTNWTMCNNCQSYRKYTKLVFDKIGSDEEMVSDEYFEFNKSESVSDSVISLLTSNPFTSVLSVSRKSILMTENILNYLITIISTLAPEISNTNLKRLVYEFMAKKHSNGIFQTAYNSMIGSPFSPVIFTNWRNSILNYRNDMMFKNAFPEYNNRFSNVYTCFPFLDTMKLLDNFKMDKYTRSRFKFMNASHYTMIKRFTNITSSSARFYWIYRDLLAYKIFFKNLGINKRLRKSSPYYQYNKRSLQLLSKRLEILFHHIINADIYNDESSVKLKNRYPYFRRHLAHLIINGDIDYFNESENGPDNDWFLRYTKLDLGTTSPSFILGRISYEAEAILNILSRFIKFFERITRGLNPNDPAVPVIEKGSVKSSQINFSELIESNTSKYSSIISPKSISIFDSKILNKSSTHLDLESLYDILKVIKEKINPNVKNDNSEDLVSSLIGSSMLVELVSARAIAGDVAVKERIMQDNMISIFSTEGDNLIKSKVSFHMKSRSKGGNYIYENNANREPEILYREFNGCCICGIKRNTILRGSLLPWRNGYVHSECVLWSVNDVLLPRTFNFNYDNFYTLFEPFSHDLYCEMFSNTDKNNDFPESVDATNENESGVNDNFSQTESYARNDYSTGKKLEETEITDEPQETIENSDQELQTGQNNFVSVTEKYSELQEGLQEPDNVVTFVNSDNNQYYVVKEVVDDQNAEEYPSDLCSSVIGSIEQLDDSTIDQLEFINSIFIQSNSKQPSDVSNVHEHNKPQNVSSKQDHGVSANDLNVKTSNSGTNSESTKPGSSESEDVNLNLFNLPVLPPVHIPDTAVEKVFKESLTRRCSWCNVLGATVTCSNDNCNVSFHLCCAFISSSKLVHSLYKKNNPDHEYQERILPVKMYYTRRKIWCASCFDLISQNLKSYHMKNLTNKNKNELLTFFSLEGMASSATRIVCRQSLQSVRLIPRLLDYKKLDVYLSYSSKLYNKTKAIYNRSMMNHPHSKEVNEFIEGILKVDEKKDHENKISSEYDFKNKYFMFGTDKDMSSVFSFKVPSLRFPDNITHCVHRIGALTLINLGEALMHDNRGVLYPIGFTSVRRFWNYNYYNRGYKRSHKRRHQSSVFHSSNLSEPPNNVSDSRLNPYHKQQIEFLNKSPDQNQSDFEEFICEKYQSKYSDCDKKKYFGISDRSFYLCSIRALNESPYFTIDLISHPSTNLPNKRLSEGYDINEVFDSFKRTLGVKFLGMKPESFFGLNLHIVLQQMRFDLCSTMMRRLTQFSKISKFKNLVLGSRPTFYDVNLRLGEPMVNYPFKISKQLMLEHITTSIEYRESEQSVVDMTDVRLNRNRSRKQLESSNTSTQYRYLVSVPPEQRLDVKPSVIHGLGLFASVYINAGEPVVEYVGELIRDVIGDQREEIYSEGQGGDGSCYMFRLDEQLIVDATRKGNMSRFINHSCDPNCLCRIVTCENGLKHIVVFAKCNLNPGDEITYDYQFGVESETRKLMCLCGAPNCLGRMN